MHVTEYYNSSIYFCYVLFYSTFRTGEKNTEKVKVILSHLLRDFGTLLTCCRHAEYWLLWKQDITKNKKRLPRSHSKIKFLKDESQH